MTDEQRNRIPDACWEIFRRGVIAADEESHLLLRQVPSTYGVCQIDPDIGWVDYIRYYIPGTGYCYDFGEVNYYMDSGFKRDRAADPSSIDRISDIGSDWDTVRLIGLLPFHPDRSLVFSDLAHRQLFSSLAELTSYVDRFGIPEVCDNPEIDPAFSAILEKESLSDDDYDRLLRMSNYSAYLGEDEDTLVNVIETSHEQIMIRTRLEHDPNRREWPQEINPTYSGGIRRVRDSKIIRDFELESGV